MAAREATSGRSVGRVVVAAGRMLLLLFGLVGAVTLLREVGLDPRAAAEAAGRPGPAAFVGIGVLACAVGVPRQVVALAGGYVFGLWSGVLLALLAEIGGCAVDFAWARMLGQRIATRWLARRQGGRLQRLDRFLSSRTFTATLTLRLLPFGSNIVLNLAAGISGVAAGPFLLASLIGYVPQTVVFALAGAGASLSSGVQLGVAVLLMVSSAALGLVLLRRRPLAA